MSSLKITKLDPRAVIPAPATSGSAGYDLSALLDEPAVIKSGERLLIPTGLAIELPSNEYCAFLFARSGLAVKHGLTLANAVGVVDSDYRGEIKIGLVNISGEDYTLQPFERIAQMVIMPVCMLPLVETEQLSETDRGAGGFGSSDGAPRRTV